MKTRFLIAFGSFFLAALARADISPKLSETTQAITSEITHHGKAYENLKELTHIGPRLSGSEGAEKAVAWAKTKMQSYGFDKVWLQPMMAPHWTRGATESAVAVTVARSVPLQVTTLGFSPGTPPTGVTAEVVEVKSLDEVKKLGDSVRGKIVFYNRPLDTKINPFEAYGKAVDQRGGGPALAAEHGAVAALVRSMTPLVDDDHPHAGMTAFKSGGPQIPAAALSTHAANTLSKLLQTDRHTRVTLKLSSANNPPVQSYNVIGEIFGRDLPLEFVVVGGHLDSWDLATGAHDDGAGVVESIEVLRSFKALHLIPRRTVRVVLFMSEEVGAAGAQEYAAQAKAKHEKHIVALESDSGGFRALGFDGNAKEWAAKTWPSWRPLFAPLHAVNFHQGGGGTDVEPLENLGTRIFGLMTDPTHYFDFHHSALDRIDVVNKDGLSQAASAMAVFIYLAAEEGV